MNIISRDKITRARLGNYTFLYNPENYTESTSIKYNEVTTCGMSYPRVVFGGSDLKTITFTVYLNDQVMSGVTKSFFRFIDSYLPKRTKTHIFKPPKDIKFVFGSYVRTCKIQSVEKRPMSFSAKLTPIEAEVDITLIMI